MKNAFPHRSALALAVILGALAASGCDEAPRSAGTDAPPAASVPPPAPPATQPPPPPSGGVNPAETARDSAATDPMGTLSKAEESKSMPMAGHGNNHSSPALAPKEKP